jgi:DnaJ-like protein
MTERKPPTVSFPDWVEGQIQAAEQAGAFKNLPGAGKPIPDIDRPKDDLDWVANLLRREQVDVASVLPPALALAKEVEVLPERLAKLRSEADVRDTVEELNARIRHAQRQPQVGPPFRVRTVNVDAAVEQWRTERAARAATVPAQPTQTPQSASAPRARRIWLPRRRARSGDLDAPSA